MTIDFPPGFVWGASTAAHQTEGGNWNNDWWEFEHRADSGCREVSGDAVDHFHRYPDDIRLLRDLGFGAYRFSIEWSRIEPEEDEWSRAALDHYRRMLACCHEHDVVPVVTFHHFTTPRWLASRGGWAEPAVVDHFARFCERSVAALGDLIGMGCTINEPNVVSVLGFISAEFPPGVRDFAAFAARQREHDRRAPEVVRRDQGRPRRLPARSHAVDERLVGARRCGRPVANAPASATKGSSAKPPAVTTTSGCRRTRAFVSTTRACRRVPSPVSSCSTWATSTGPRASRSPSATRPRRPASRST